MTVSSKIRLYDLAKELKLDTKRLIEEVRREGVDVSVPSNSVSKELAEKIQTSIFRKKRPSQNAVCESSRRAERAVEEAPPVETIEVAPEPEPEVSAPIPQAEAPAPPAPAGVPKQPTTRLIKKLAPAVRAEQPATVTAAPAAEVQEAPVEIEDASSSPQQNGVTQAEVAPSGIPATAPPAVAPAPSRQVRVMRPTMAALSAGIRPGERAPTPVVPPTVTPRERVERAGTRVRERTPLARTERLGTPGETATPQTTYIPPPDAGRRRSRRTPARGGRKIEGKAGRFDKGDFIPPPKALSLEDRIAGRMEPSTTPGELKAVRIIEGSTVKEFAEKLGIKPKDIVSLLLQRKVFATINQPLNDDVAVELGQRFGYEVTFVPFEEMVAEEEFEGIDRYGRG